MLEFGAVNPVISRRRMSIRTLIVYLAAGSGLVLAHAASGQQSPGSAAPSSANVSMCVGCHGIPGYRTAYPSVYQVPKIAGQQPAYIVKALQAYKSGERKHGSMRGIVATMTEKDMADLAAYYAAGGGK